MSSRVTGSEATGTNFTGGSTATSGSTATRRSNNVRILSDSDVLSICHNINYTDLTRLCKKMHIALGYLDSIVQPERISARTPYGATMMYMPAFQTRGAGMKTITIPSDGPIKGNITVYHRDGSPIAFINAAEATGFRTALGSITLLMIRKDVPELANPTTMTVFGSGKQAEWAIRLCMIVFPHLKKINISSRSEEHAMDLLEKVFQPNGTDIEVHPWAPCSDETDDLVASSDLVFCCTPSKIPLFNPDALFDGPTPKFVSLIGSYRPDMIELDFTPLKDRNDVVFVVDTVDGVLDESGEVIAAELGARQLHPLATLPFDDNEGGRKEGWACRFRTDTVVYKSVGCGVMDMSVAESLVLLAKKTGVGTVVPF